MSDKEKEAALVLSRAVAKGEALCKAGETDVATIIRAMKAVIGDEPLAKIDYVEAVDAATIEPVTTVRPGTLFAMAVYIGKTRLIDNFVYAG